MNYLPIFSPVYGIVNFASSESVTININDQKKNVFTPMFGKLNAMPTNQLFIASIMNKYLDVPVKFTIDGEVDVDKEDTVDYNQDIGTNLTGTQCHLNFGSCFIPVVDKGTEVNAGNTAIGYIKIKQKIILKSEPRQLIILSVPSFNFDTNNIQPTYAYDLYSKQLVNEIKKTLTKSNYDICIYMSNLTKICTGSRVSEGSGKDNFESKKSYPKAIRNKIKMKINEIKLSDITPSELNIIYLFDFCSFHPNSFQNIRIPDPDVSILFPNSTLLLLAEELADTLRECNILVTKHISYGNEMVQEFYQYNTEYELEKYYTSIIPIQIAIREGLPETKVQIIANSINKWISTINLYLFTKFNQRATLAEVAPLLSLSRPS